MWLHIRALGQWTNRLYEHFEQEQLNMAGSISDLRSKTDAFTKGDKWRRYSYKNLHSTLLLNVRDLRGAVRGIIIVISYLGIFELQILIHRLTVDRKNEPLTVNPLTADSKTRPQFRSVGDSYATLIPESEHSSVTSSGSSRGEYLYIHTYMYLYSKLWKIKAEGLLTQII
jgi:hypothetical protein